MDNRRSTQQHSAIMCGRQQSLQLSECFDHIISVAGTVLLLHLSCIGTNGTKKLNEGTSLRNDCLNWIVCTGSDGLCTLCASEIEREPPTISAAIDHSLQAFGHARAKTIQAQAVQATLQGRDIFVSVPTGYGKS